MQASPRTRLAPTPSGYLHPGNAWSFLITWLCARSQGGSIHLRIDDLDTGRYREEYLEDVFASLEWLGLDWDTGPRTVSEIESAYSQRLRIPVYRAVLDTLIGRVGPGGPLLYPCACSREKVKRDALAAGRPGIYPGTCRNAGIAFGKSSAAASGDTVAEAAEADSHPLRLRVPDNAEVTLKGLGSGPLGLRPGLDMGDFVVWQKNGEPAYQLASLVDDEEFGMDLVVRGSDLLPSTGAQAWLAGILGFKAFPRARFVHHGLMLGPEGGKLSKSEGADSLRGLRTRLGSPRPLLGYFARRLGMDGDGIERAADLLAGFDPRKVPSTPILWGDFALETGLG